MTTTSELPCTTGPAPVAPNRSDPPREPAASVPRGRSRLKEMMTKGGVVYTLLYGTRAVGQRILDRFDRWLVKMEQRRNLVEPWAITARRHTTAENKQLWNTYDWSARGEEWTTSAEWKAGLVREWLLPNFPAGGTYLEIGPGGGRWTEVLQTLAARLYLVDVAELPIALCKKRFAHYTNIEYAVGNGRTLDAESDSLDGIWSYDVFVHITPLDVRNYLREFARVLKPGARAVIHHAGAPLPGDARRAGWRSDLTDKMFQLFVREAGLEIVAQTEEFVNPGDQLTLLRKPGGTPQS